MGDDILIPIVIIYDISDDKLRNELYKELLYFGFRRQYSLFEAIVTKGELKEIKRVISQFSSFENVSINLYTLSQKAYEDTIRLGKYKDITNECFII